MRDRRLSQQLTSSLLLCSLRLGRSADHNRGRQRERNDGGRTSHDRHTLEACLDGRRRPRALSLGVVALSRGETINAVWLVAAAICTYLLAYRFYSLFIADRVLQLDPKRLTPARRFNDGLDYCPTDKTVLFGHHFAAIAGAGPLVGPVLAAQMGYLPGTLWLLVGTVFAGAVQDFIILWASTRRDGRSLGDMIRSELGEVAGFVAMIGVLLIMIILLAVLALVVVKALKQSPWATFTVMMTIPIAVLMGVYGRFLRPAASARCR